MPATMRGVYHNLKESKYTVSNGEIVYFFSSEFYRGKFLAGYENNRETFYNKISKFTDNDYLNMDSLADIAFYKSVEKRGFFVRLKGAKINEMQLHQYALRRMTIKDSPVWEKVTK